MSRPQSSSLPPDLTLALLRTDLPTLDLHGRSRWEAEYELFHFLKDHPGQIVHIITGHGGGVVAEATLNYLRALMITKKVLGFEVDDRGGHLVAALGDKRL